MSPTHSIGKYHGVKNHSGDTLVSPRVSLTLRKLDSTNINFSPQFELKSENSKNSQFSEFFRVFQCLVKFDLMLIEFHLPYFFFFFFCISHAWKFPYVSKNPVLNQ